jgi:hypothetical protein
MKKKFFVSLFVVGVLLSGTIMAKERPLKVFIFAGQSNMVGAGAAVSDLPEDLKGEQKMALFFDGGKWVMLAPGKTEKRGFGPEISFSRKLSAEIKEPIGIIKHSVVGTNLAQHWSPANPKSLYAELLKKVSAAQQTRKTEMVGMIWMQGEKPSGLHSNNQERLKKSRDVLCYRTSKPSERQIPVCGYRPQRARNVYGPRLCFCGL